MLGVLAVAPPVYDLVSPASTAAGHPAIAGQISAIRVSGAHHGPLTYGMAGGYRPERIQAHRRPTGTAGSHNGSSSGTSTSAASSPSHRASAAGTGHTALTCSGTGGTLPANYATIVAFLTAHGYTGLAAAGIAGNIYQESMGNPESVGTGGGGLIGWTPLPAGFVTGNPAADLQTQLAALLTFNQQWSQYMPMLNAATSATEAADIYMNYFERPGIPAAANREAAANAVATACGL